PARGGRRSGNGPGKGGPPAPPHRAVRAPASRIGLDPVRERREMPLLYAHPESLLLGVVVRTDRDRGHDAGVKALDALEGTHEPVAGEKPARALGALREEHAGEV